MIKSKIPSDENTIFKSKNKSSYVITSLITIAVICLFFLYNAMQTYKCMFMGLVSFNSSNNYLITAVCFFLIIPITIFFVVYGFMPEIVLTDKKIYMRKLWGGQYIVALDEHIVAFLHYTEDGYRGSRHYKMCLYFDNGGRFTYGLLSISNESSIKLTGLLQQKIQNKISTDGLETDSNFAFEDFVNESRNNRIITTFDCLLIIIGAIMLLLFFTGVNEMGHPENIRISGTIENKVDHSGKTSDTYSIQIVSIEGITYNIFVSDQVFNRYDIDNSITVKAKKGLLGIVYNEKFY